VSIQQRRERERAERHRLIVQAAKDLAEAEGWEAVTTRRLAERVEYSQPVLYSHFAGKDAIMAAVAVEGFAELTADLHRARTAQNSPRAALSAAAEAYLDFARTRTTLYQVMFVLPLDILWADDTEAADLEAAFGELLAAVRPLAGDRDPVTLTETIWSALHGLATLAHTHRLRPDHDRHRLELLLDHFPPIVKTLCLPDTSSTHPGQEAC
jgi:AcrR family transcriptional regulator